MVLVYGDQRYAFGASWTGTIQWRMGSQLRQNHKRRNWFVGVFSIPNPAHVPRFIQPQDVTISTMRAGGPGGQHQNTTDSAVRAVHKPSGLTVAVRDGRSQHRNKALAIERLENLMNAATLMEEETHKNAQHDLHKHLERGNPIRRFEGKNFVERK